MSCSAKDDNPHLDLTAWRAQMSTKGWRATLKEVARNKDAQAVVRRNTHTRRPLGSDNFLSKVVHVLGSWPPRSPVAHGPPKRLAQEESGQRPHAWEGPYDR